MTGWVSRISVSGDTSVPWEKLFAMEKGGFWGANFGWVKHMFWVWVFLISKKEEKKSCLVCQTHVCVWSRRRGASRQQQKHSSLNLCRIIIPKIADEVDPVSLYLIQAEKRGGIYIKKKRKTSQSPNWLFAPPEENSPSNESECGAPVDQ